MFLGSDFSPQISVVIPTFNRATLLKEAINSVVNQTYSNWELIIVDNYSTDDTDSIVDFFQDDRILITKLHFSGSVSASRNLGVNLARAEWIAFLDSDDYWAPTKLEEVVSFINSNVDVIYHNVGRFGSSKITSKIKVHKSRKLKSPVYLDFLLNGNTIALSSVTVRKSILAKIGGMDESRALFGMEDFETWLRIASISENFFHISKVLGYYRIHEGGISNQNSYERLVCAIDSHLKSLTPAQLKKFQSLYIYGKGINCFKNGDYTMAETNFRFVIKNGRYIYRLKSIWLLLKGRCCRMVL